MPKISILLPTDQPLGNRRLLEELRECYDNTNYDQHLMCVAFAKSGPLLKLDPHLSNFKSRGGKVFSIFGIDHKGTSIQALAYALKCHTQSFITNYPYSTFHPKIYIFSGPKSAVAFIGSNNMTVGGLETNFESGVRVEYTLPDELTDFKNALCLFESLLPENCTATYELTPDVLKAHIEDGLLLDENVSKPAQNSTATISPTKKPPQRFYKKGFKLKPPSPLAKPKASSTNTPASSTGTGSKSVITTTATASGLVMQIKPHHNGEVFLSKLAVNQDPAFFGWPFTGKTTPKIAGKVPYPQREPDPVVNITVIGKDQTTMLELEKYALNTIYYEAKSEIRITASPLVSVVPEYSIMVLSKSDDPELDYEMIIHTPDSPDYAAWLSLCTQSMPGGGKTPRKFGWF